MKTDSFGPELLNGVLKLIEERTSRLNLTYGGGKFVGAVFGLWQAVSAYRANIPFKEALKNVLSAFVITAVISGGLRYSMESGKVRKAVLALKPLLIKEASKRADLRGFLKNNKYIYIDRNGNITGAKYNINKLRVGRLRILSKEILGGAAKEAFGYPNPNN